jgi:hypothetical protein
MFHDTIVALLDCLVLCAGTGPESMVSCHIPSLMAAVVLDVNGDGWFEGWSSNTMGQGTVV